MARKSCTDVSRCRLPVRPGHGPDARGHVKLLSFPRAIHQGSSREHEYGMATQAFGPWFGEQLIGLGVSLVLGSPAIALIYLVLRRAGAAGLAGGSGGRRRHSRLRDPDSTGVCRP